MIVTNLAPVSGASGTGNPVESPFARLKQFDTAFLIDDSGSMTGTRWSQTRTALEAIVPVCTEQNEDGVDIHFLNSKLGKNNVTTKEEVFEIFKDVKPRGMTPTGKRLREILEPYVASVEKRGVDGDWPKPLNLIVITDGEASDDEEENSVRYVIVEMAGRLNTEDAPLTQLGIQFFQVGNDEAASKALEELDNDLAKKHNVRDMVDTEPFSKGGDFSQKDILKIVLGSMDRKVDKQNEKEKERLGGSTSTT